eukprot:2222014-Amphidinium_carterae.1
MSESQDFGNRFLFRSGVQCIYHQVAHHHFQLSSSQIKSDSIVLQLLVKETHLQQNSQEAVNGFCRSLNVSSLPFTEIYVTGAIHICQSLAEWLSSPQGISLTRESISHFESFYQASRVASL